VSQPQKVEKVSTRIWLEEPEPTNSFAARNAWLHGYDVYGEMLGRARWADMMYLLFRGEAPTKAQAALLDALSLVLANGGPRDPAVHAAMCGAVGGSTAASCLMAALAVGAGRLGGGREVLSAMQAWEHCGLELEAWQRHLSTPPAEAASVWPTTEHAAGFEAHGAGMAGIVRRALSYLASISPGPRLGWLFEQRHALALAAGSSPAMTGVAAAALADLGFKPAQGEMLYLLLRLPGAAAHALEQGETGHKQFPFFQLDLLDDPGKASA